LISSNASCWQNLKCARQKKEKCVFKENVGLALFQTLLLISFEMSMRLRDFEISFQLDKTLDFVDFPSVNKENLQSAI